MLLVVFPSNVLWRNREAFLTRPLAKFKSQCLLWFSPFLFQHQWRCCLGSNISATGDQLSLSNLLLTAWSSSHLFSLQLLKLKNSSLQILQKSLDFSQYSLAGHPRLICRKAFHRLKVCSGWTLAPSESSYGGGGVGGRSSRSLL